MDSTFNYGDHALEVAASSDEAKALFNAGLRRAYAFNHEDAGRFFKSSAEVDPGCVMAHWGVAYVSWTNYNNPDLDFDVAQSSYDALENSKIQLKGGSGELEALLVGALQARVGGGPGSWPRDGANVAAETKKKLDQAYCTAMAGVYERFPDSPDVAALFIESVMNLNPWRIWVVKPEAEGERVGDARSFETADRVVKASDLFAVFEKGLKSHPNHLGLRHFWIHFLEMSSNPDRALESEVVKEFPGAKPLVEVCPGSGHLLHMPSHVDVLCGRYADGIRANELGAGADREYASQLAALGESPANFYTLYRCHNLHFLVYCAMFDGQCARALEAAHDLGAMLPESLLLDTSYFPPTGAAWLESFVPLALHVHVRFGKWEAILSDGAIGPHLSVTEALAKPDLYPCTIALLHYARGIAHAVRAETMGAGELAMAEEEAGLFTKAVARVRDPACPHGTRMLFNNEVGSILAVAEAMLAGELLYRKGEHEAAFEALRKAVDLDDSLPYDEPWGWMQPARHALGALLLEQGRAEEAERVYRLDLGMPPSPGEPPLARALAHPNNPWSLRGLAGALAAQGKGREAAEMEAAAGPAAARSDVGIAASCMCARAAASG